MIEYRTEHVTPEQENNIIGILGKFGWQIIDSQEIYSENTEILGADIKSYGTIMSSFTSNDGVINVRQRKTITNYVALRFQRDTEIENYDELSDLNAEFEETISYLNEPKKPIKRTAVLAIGTILLVISIILAIVENNSAELWEIIVSIAFMAVMIPLTVFGWVKFKKRLSNYEYIQSRLYEILNEAEELIG